MSYIEREAALDHIRDYIEEYSWHTDEHGFHSPEWCAMKEAEMVLTGLPAADVRPVRRGTWTDAAITADNLYDTQGMLCQIRGYICSCCHEFSLARFNFCPNCGAMMEES